MKSAYSALVFCLSLALHTMHAQTGGDPTSPPSGTPARTMKSLDQIEARTPLVDHATGVSIDPNGNITISESGSYYLTANLSVPSGDAITITASGVTLDLNGFTISSSSATLGGTAISFDTVNVRITNGHIEGGTSYDSGAESNQFSGTGLAYGIFGGSNAVNCEISSISISGMGYVGILLYGTNTSVESCRVETCGYQGITAYIVTNSSVTDAGDNAIEAVLVDACYAESVAGYGIHARQISNSYGNGPATGIYASAGGFGGSVVNCYGYSNGTESDSYGIYAACSVTDSYGYSENSSGIRSLANVENSRGYSAGNIGIQANRNIMNSYGRSISTGSEDHGISCLGNVLNSTGSAQYGHGIYCEGNVNTSIGTSNSTSSTSDGIHCVGTIANSSGATASTGSGYGLFAIYSVINSYGNSSGYSGIGSTGPVMNSYGLSFGSSGDAHGIQSNVNVAHSYGQSDHADGINAQHTISYSRGVTSGTDSDDDGIDCEIAIGCTASGGENVTNKYNMP